MSQTGFNKGRCEPLEDILYDMGLKKAIEKAGFDFGSIRITVDPAGGE